MTKALLSFPRKRESIVWIPACAGMTRENYLRGWHRPHAGMTWTRMGMTRTRMGMTPLCYFSLFAF